MVDIFKDMEFEFVCRYAQWGALLHRSSQTRQALTAQQKAHGIMKKSLAAYDPRLSQLQGYLGKEFRQVPPSTL